MDNKPAAVDPTTTEHEEQPPPRMAEPELRQLAMDTAQGKVFTDRHGDNAIDAFRVVFMLGLGGHRPKYLDQWGMIYEYIDKAGPRAINGRPSFFSFRILHADDLPHFLDLYREVRTTLDNFAKGTSGG